MKTGLFNPSDSPLFPIVLLHFFSRCNKKCNIPALCYTFPMGTITARHRQDGTTGYTATIRIKRDGVLVHSETQTFNVRATARAWLKRREAELVNPGALGRSGDPTLAQVIEVYQRELSRPAAKTKAQVLRSISATPLGALRCTAIDSPALVRWAMSIGGQPQTRGNYIAHLSSVFSVARSAWGYPLDEQAMRDARTVLKKMGSVTRSASRTRRPTVGELQQLLAHYAMAETKRTDAMPMRRLIMFALFSTRRLDEITRLRWADLDRQASDIVVRDMKNPGEKIGNHVRCLLPPEALAIIDLQPQTGPLIWPHNGKSMSSSFTRTCQVLGIVDLHFHDLRHEGISRLFEMGWAIPRVATVSGHRTWQSLQRYTQYRAAGDKLGAWDWMGWVTAETPPAASLCR